MVMSLNQIMKINRKINIFFLLKKMQIIVVNSLKSLKNLYLCLYRRSTTDRTKLISLEIYQTQKTKAPEIYVAKPG